MILAAFGLPAIRVPVLSKAIALIVPAKARGQAIIMLPLLLGNRSR